MEAWRDELYHHGILGMKWGRKQGPPYPLGASDHSAAEKKAGWRQSLKDDRANRAKQEAKTAHKIANSYTKAMDKKAEKRQKEADDFRAKQSLTKEQKKINKIEKKYDKKIERSRKLDDKVNTAREKRHNKIEDKYNKKIDKAKNEDYKKSLEATKKAKLKDFDLGTKYFNKAQDKYNNVIESYKKAKMNAVGNKSYKNDPAFKEAVKKYYGQVAYDLYFSNVGGSTYTKLIYASNMLNESTKNQKKKNR